MQNEIAVRLYESQKYGSTYGKGKYHSAVFNAAADLKEPDAKYLLDFYSFAEWKQTARNEEEVDTVDLVSETADKDTLASWVLHYDTRSKVKRPVLGFATLNLRTNVLDLAIVDDAVGVRHRWQLAAKSCKRVVGKTAPTLLATNADLGQW